MPSTAWLCQQARQRMQDSRYPRPLRAQLQFNRFAVRVGVQLTLLLTGERRNHIGPQIVPYLVVQLRIKSDNQTDSLNMKTAMSRFLALEERCRKRPMQC